ncbi:NAD(P)H-dependent flavin oxidoreductase YrpB (nitropropane dioxygenase family) [Aequitasia blattaphilus]|uniref:Probable nitronate monooxygenase n=1 Tax=Aequitasia blattaphilus TaxID=2949332 RepID=A0ABT1E8E5_9FIRM|nr:nitronate monooxygenase family protein [Aequitasia blattaphilus]MCP1101889.1 nitronate monooxygenase family protein [Aequitasia blattaphilus]MCR8614529.1 nitronate monooxygenase family protein [Aequitasia blattaphilus]
MAKEVRIGELSLKIPVIQGGMGVGVSLSSLAGAVAKAGGMGIISTAQIGFAEPDFDTNTKEANERAILKEFQKAKEIAPEGVIGFNIMVALKDYAQHVKAAVEAGADIIISGAGIPTELPKYVGAAKTKIAPVVSTIKSAKVLLKFWDRKYKRIPDLLVIEGPKAGGHLGFSKESLDQMNDETYKAEVKGILELKKDYEIAYNQKIPVALGGGIEDKESADAAFSLGVDAVVVGTKFITTEECDAHPSYKEAFIQADEEDVVLTKSPVGMPGRAIKNQFLERVNKGEKIPHTPCHGCLAKCNPSDIPYCITDTLVAAVTGDVENGLIFSGEYGYKATKITTVKDVISAIID